jgi:hypothetical protein
MPCFGIVTIWDFVGNAWTIEIVLDYDVRLVYCFFLQVHLHLNLVKATMEVALIEHDDMFFGKIMSNDNAIISTLRNE